jgi:[ribosomal protein S5]-alanine N-acetyltransferase
MTSVYHSPFPNIKINEKLILREQSLNDAEDFLKYYSKTEVNQYILAEVPTTIPAALNEIAYCYQLFYQRKGIYWTLAKVKNNKMIGALGLYQRSPDELEICYELDSAYWSKGIISKAIRKCIKFGFKHMHCKLIFALTTKDNNASIRVLEKNHFKFEQTLEKHRLFKGELHDVERFILKK